MKLLYSERIDGTVELQVYEQERRLVVCLRQAQDSNPAVEVRLPSESVTALLEALLYLADRWGDQYPFAPSDDDTARQ